VFLLIGLCYVWCYPEYFYHKVLGQQIIQLYWGQGWVWGGGVAEPGVYTHPRPTHVVKQGGHENYGHDHTI